jgi:aldehyde dehydrogenase (NAD+)
MFNTGQSCDAPTRLLVERSCYDEVIEIAQRAAEQTRVDDPELEGVLTKKPGWSLADWVAQMD